MSRRAHDPFAPAAPQSLTGVVEPPAPPVEDDTGRDDTGDVAAMLPDDLDDIGKPDLIALAELAGVATSGTKADLADRIRGART